jgi:predicted amidophosphoribosyltransferase
LQEKYGRWGRCRRCNARLVDLNAGGGPVIKAPYEFRIAAAAGLYVSDHASKGEIGAQILILKNDASAAGLFAELIDLVLRKRYPSISFDVVVPIPHGHGATVKATTALAAELSKRRGVPMVEALAMDPSYKSLKKASEQEKFDSTKDKIHVINPDEIRGRRPLLIDDVLTTCGHAHWSALELRRAGAMDVNVAVLGRDVDQRDLSFIGHSGRF